MHSGAAECVASFAKRVLVVAIALPLLAIVDRDTVYSGGPAPLVASRAGSPRTEIHLFGYPGDYIAGYRSWFYDCPYGWEFQAYDASGDGIPDQLYIFYGVWQFTFWTDQTGRNLVPGVFPQAVRAIGTPPGFAGMDISGDGRGCNALVGSFTVLEATYDYVNRDVNNNPRVLSFAIQFEQHCERSDSLPLLGTILYNSTIVEDDQPPTVTDVTVSKKRLRRDGRHPVTISWTASDDDQITGFAIVVTDGSQIVGGVKAIIPPDSRSFEWTPDMDMLVTKNGQLHVYAIDRAYNVGEGVYAEPLYVR